MHAERVDRDAVVVDAVIVGQGDVAALDAQAVDIALGSRGDDLGLGALDEDDVDGQVECQLVAAAPGEVRSSARLGPPPWTPSVVECARPCRSRG
jgi:hypothetical protein